MLRRVLVTFALFIAVGFGTVAHAQHLTSKELLQGFRDGQLLAKPRLGVTESALTTQEALHGASAVRKFAHVGNIRVLSIPANANAVDMINKLRGTGLYEYIEPDYLRHALKTPNDPKFSTQWDMQNTGQGGGVSGDDIHAVTAWDTRSTAPDVIVGLIDTGVRLTHEDLAPNLWVNKNETPGNGIDDDADNYIDDVHGINAYLGPNLAKDGDPSDDAGHGTAVGSVIAAAGNNGKGMAGVAWQTQLMVLKAADSDGLFSISATVAAVNYAIAHGAKVLNGSYGATQYSQAEYDSLKSARDAGVIFVAAAGNDAADNSVATGYPASYLLENVVAVANSNQSDQLDPSSTYGALVELAAPGTSIVSAANTGDSDYGTETGTSLAAPHVTGALALLAEQFPGDDYHQLINRLLRSVDQNSSLSGKVLTGGRLNLQKALTSTVNRPFNDDFANAAVISGNAIATRGANAHGTSETNEPSLSGVTGGASLWWKWTPTTTGSAVVDTSGSTFDTVVAVYTGSALNALTQVAMNDDAGSGVTTSRATFSVNTGTTYYIRVDGKNGATGEISMTVGTVPGNDNFANAQTISGTAAQTTGSNLQASAESGEPSVTGSYANGSGHTVWFKWTAPKSTDFTVAVYTQSFLPVVGVYTGSSVSQLTKVSSEDIVTSFTATANTTYYIAVDGASGTSGSFTLTLLEAYFGFTMADQANSSPSVGPNSLVVSDNSGGVLYLDEQNNNNSGWSQPLTGTQDVNSPVSLSDDSFYTTNSGGIAHVTRQQTVDWQKSFGTSVNVSSSPAVGSDGTVYVHSDDGTLHALTSTGSEKWTLSIPGISYASPSIGADGTIYLGSDNHNLYAISPGGSIKWQFDAGDQIYSSVAIGSDGTLYFGTLGSKFYAVTSAGAQKWVYTVGGEVSSSPAIAPDGTIYFGSYDDKVYALTSSGTLKWTVTTGDQIRASSPAIASDGSIFIGSYDGNLYQISSSGTVVQKYPSAAAIRSSPLFTQGNLVWGSGDMNVYFGYMSSLDLANSSWPLFRGNPARTGRFVTNTAPSIVTQPGSTAVAIGGSVTLSVTATGADPLTFQWYLNGNAISGANQSSYTINNASNADAGSYTVVITNSLGSVTSSAATVTVATASNIGRIVNLSARAVAGSGDQTLIVGFVIGSGTGTKQLLVRGVGPTLASYGVTSGFLPDPMLTLFNDSQTQIGSNDDWGTDPNVPSVSQQVGAFNLVSTKDAATVVSLAGGQGYTAKVTSSPNSTTNSGIVLAEFYDATQVFTSDTPRLVNISARSQVGTGGNVLIVGFVIGGSTPVKVLIRGIGPTLVNYGLSASSLLADPQIQVTALNDNTNIIAQNDNWGSSSNLSDIQAAMTQVNAFALPANSKDAVVLVTLNPGAYTAVVSGVNNTTGVALAEVYEVQ